MREITPLLMILLLTLPVATQQKASAVQPNAPLVQFGEARILHSKILKEDRPYWIYLPQSYKKDVSAKRKYPVLYLLDAESHFAWASEEVQYMADCLQIPELIVVAIPNTDRNRDLTPTHDPVVPSSGGGVSFEKFLNEELVPDIDASLPTAPYRILVGHSLGGVLVVDAFLRRSGVFQAFIAMEPSVLWDNQILIQRANELSKTKDLTGAIFIATANHPQSLVEPVSTMRTFHEHLISSLKTNAPAGLRIGYQYFESEDHSSVRLTGLYNGLRFVFDDYKPAKLFALDEPSLIEDHFTKLSQRFGYEILPPEEYVNKIASGLLEAHETNKAIECFKLNITNYPTAALVYSRLADAYLIKNEKRLAVQNYEKALALNPEDRETAERLRRLKPATNPTGPLTNGVYKIINCFSGKALAVADGSITILAAIVQAKYDGDWHQLWAFTNLGDGYYQVTAVHSTSALDVDGESIADGAKLIQFPYHDGANQVWQVIPNGDGTYRLLNEHSRFALAVADASRQDGAAVDQSAWKSKKNQKWRIKAVSPVRQ